MRVLLPLLIATATLAACSKDGGGNNAAAAAPQPTPTGPPPLTPKMDVTPAPGNEPAWSPPPSNAADPHSAPYGNLLDQPLVNAQGKTG